MSEDKNNEQQRTATQTVAKAQVDDAIVDDGPVEHETVFARKQDGGLNTHLGKRPLTPTSSKTGKHATKRDFGSFHGSSSNWPPSPKLALAGQAPTREDANARKKGKSALDASPVVETPRKHDAPSKQSDRDGSPPPAPKEAEVENRANSDVKLKSLSMLSRTGGTKKTGVGWTLIIRWLGCNISLSRSLT